MITISTLVAYLAVAGVVKIAYRDYTRAEALKCNCENCK